MDITLQIDVVGNFYSPSAPEQNDEILAPSKLSKSAQNLRALLADVTKPDQKDGAAAAKALLDSSKKAKSSSSGERRLYCTAISRYCFKSGRRTIPPWFVIATSGYGTFASTRTNWDKVSSVKIWHLEPNH